MNKISVAILGLMGIFLEFSLCFGYDVADMLRFPLDNYSRLNNILGTYNAVGNNKYHLGEDVSANATNKAYAIGNGQVKHAKNHPAKYDSSGNLIRNYGGMYVIEHALTSGEKVCSLYAHLNFETFTKKEGDKVEKGEYLGQIGTAAQNGSWSEHLHFGILKGGYPSNPDAYVCGDWILGGYTGCVDIVSNWHSPTEFINGYGSNISLPYRLVGNVAWYPPNKSCVEAERWRFFACGYPNCGQSLGFNDICQQEEYEMVMALGGYSNTDWYLILYGTQDLDQVLTCHQ